MEIRLSAFADDTTLYIGENTSLIHLQNQLQDFELFAGVKYNRDKCIGMWLGANIDNRETSRLQMEFKKKKTNLVIYTDKTRKKTRMLIGKKSKLKYKKT